MKVYFVASIAGIKFNSARDALYAAASEASCTKQPQEVRWQDESGKSAVFATVIHGENS